MERKAKHFQKRDAILSCLRSTTTHPTADWIYEQLRQSDADISLATVYRNLAKFKAEGKIMSVATVKGVERFDANTDPHVHYICTGCGRVLDLHQIRVPEELNQAAAANSGGEVTGCQLTFTGVCGHCAENI